MRTTLVHATAGAGTQLFLSGILGGGILIGGPFSLKPLFWTSIAVLGVWLWSISGVWFQFRVVFLESRISDSVTEHTTRKLQKKLERARRLKSIYRRFAHFFFQLPVLVSYAYGASFARSGAIPMIESDVSQLVHSALLGFGALVSTIAVVYFSNISAAPGRDAIRIPARHLFPFPFLFCVPLSQALFTHFGIAGAAGALDSVVPFFNGALALELVVRTVLLPFQPANPRIRRRELMDSYLLQIIHRPKRIGGTIHDMLFGILGFDVSGNKIYSRGQRLVIPLVFCSLFFLFLLSGIVVIEPGNQAAVVTLGRFSGRILSSGMHVKYPWPFGKLRRYDTDIIRCIHVGSHRPETPGASVFREGVPLLWTNMHGIRSEELLIVASPRNLIQGAVQSGGKVNSRAEKAPSISLAGADVVVEYVITDLGRFLFSYSDPEEYLRIFAESRASLHILRHEIDDLFSDKRLATAEHLKRELQSACDSLLLGVKILHVGITAVHPPLEVADAFEKNVSARQDRETIIQQAERKAIQSQVETAGSVGDFQTLIGLIEGGERGAEGSRTETERLLLSCGGDVSRIFAEAIGYRWSRENTEGGNAERFNQERRLHRAASGPYRYERYLSVLENSLKDKKKTILMGKHRNAVIGMGTNESWGIDDLPMLDEPK